ncbi:CD276 antigen-like [Chanos chanos]|uniref:CD276 antigen-like n=1 Tax=Chanos chanos TaxID=29144 RepID=A0A6J2W327_CHACN|nr:CD276 antigen-like [Chanos chanos]
MRHVLLTIMIALTELVVSTNQDITAGQVVTAAPGSNVTLGCSFPVRETLSLDHLIVTWQRGTVVVHSFYRGKDQLEKQSRAYKGRTSLSADQLETGNASLSLHGVQADDHGKYSCHVVSESWENSKDLHLLVAAPYDAPEMAVHVGCESINVTLTSAQGFPEPTIVWKGGLSQSNATTVELDGTGRYKVESVMSLSSKETQTVSVEMTLDVLRQTFKRSITLHPPPACCLIAEHRTGFPVFGVICLFIAVLLLGCVIVIRKKAC